MRTDVSQLFGIDWLDSTELVLGYSPDSTAATRLGTVPTRGATLSPLVLEAGEDCQQSRFGNPHVLKPGRLAFSLVCSESIEAADALVSVLEVSTPSAETTSLGSVGFTSDSPSQIAPSPDGERVLVGLGSLCGVIVEATATGMIPLGVTVRDGYGTFALDDQSPGPDCSDRGWAMYPAWTPDGQAISFFAAPSAIGVTGPSRAEVPASLFTMHADGSRMSVIEGDVKLPRGLDYSPDGNRLAFGGEINGRAGIWVLDLKTEDLKRVYDGPVAWLAWSPDGSQIAATVTASDEPPFPKQIVLVKL